MILEPVAQRVVVQVADVDLAEADRSLAAAIVVPLVVAAAALAYAVRRLRKMEVD